MEDEVGWKQDELWKVVNAGGQIITNTPKGLWDSAVEYFKWCDSNPLKSKRTLTSGKTQGEKVEIEAVRPYTIKGFCLHAGISERYLNDIGQTHSKDSEFYMVVEKILGLIYNQNLEGAVVDFYNPIMVSKLLKLDGDKEPENRTIKIEMVSSQSSKLSNSESEILQNLDLEKVNLLKDKAENFERQNGSTKGG